MRFSHWLGGVFAVTVGAAVAIACGDSEPPDVPAYGPAGGLAGQSPDVPGPSSEDSGAPVTVIPSGDGGEGGTMTVTPAYACVTAGGTIADPDGGCAVSWTKDIFPNMQAGGTWNCAGASPCHGGATAPVMTGSASAVYTTLANYASAAVLGNANTYFNPCATDPNKSNFVCNTEATGAATLCGNSMPLGTAIADAGIIATWVACGAPEN